MNRYTFEELEVGMEASFSMQVSETSMDLFCTLTGDISPIHMEDAHAKQRGHKGRVVYGMLSASLFSTLAGVYLPGESCLLHSVEAKFAKPVYIGDTLTVTGKISEINETFRTIVIKASIVNQHGQRVTRGLIQAGVETPTEGEP